LISVGIWYFLIPHKILYVVVTVFLFTAGVIVSRDLTQEWGKDPHQIVIDEYSCFLVPLYFTPLKLVPLIITFLLFRLFDIVKPPPLKSLERVPGGWGVMLDDLGAAVYTAVVALVLFAIFRL